MVWPRMVKFTAVPSKKVPRGLARVELHRGVRGKLPSTLTQPSRVPNFSPHGLSPCGLPPSAPGKLPLHVCAATHRANGASPRGHSEFFPNGRHADLAWGPNRFNKEARGYANAPGNNLGQECKHREGPSHPYPRTGHLGPTSSARWHGAPFASYKSKWNAGRPERRPVKYMAHTNHPKMFQPATVSQPRKLSQHEQKHRPT